MQSRGSGGLINQLLIIWLLSEYFFEPEYTIDYTSEKHLGFYVTSHSFVISEDAKYIGIIDLPGFFEWDTIRIEKTVPIFGKLELKNTAKIEVAGLDYIPDVIPAFYLKGLDDKNASANLETGIFLAVDILTSLTGFGNLLKFRHLFKALKLTTEVVKNARRIKVLAATKIFISGVEVTSGVIGAMVTMSNDCDSDFCRKLRTCLFYMDMLTLSADALTSRLLKKSAKVTLDVSSKTSRTIDNSWEVFELLEKLAGNKGSSFKALSQIEVKNLLKNITISARALKETLVLLHQLGVQVFKNIGDNLAPATVLATTDNYKIIYKNTDILDGTEDIIKSFAEKIDNIRQTNGKLGVKRYLDDLTTAQRLNADKMWKELTYDELFEIPPKAICFLAGTLVSTEKGLTPIENLKKGLRVYSYNSKEEKVELKPIKETYKNKAVKYVEIHLEKEIIRATGNHRFWIPELNKWLPARNLKKGMVLLNQKKEFTKINSTKITDEMVDTYNIEVSENSNYFVGTNLVLTHNTSKLSRFASLFEKDVEFYTINSRNGNMITDLYVGQTVQGIGKRYDQHVYEYRNDSSKKPWMADADAVSQIRINGKKGPFRMTPFEAAVVEFYEIQRYGGIEKYGGKLKNKVRPIGKVKFDLYKKIGILNPCRFYV